MGSYRTQSVAFAVGQEIDVTDEQGALLLRDAPTSFERIDAVPAAVEAEAGEGIDGESSPDLGAMSTETATGLVVPDRRARGGRKRGA